ncbi:MAG: hypothetical protein PUD39_03760, partial [Bacteroidales bacterium]|nr:hypothetical protein [Bacteroidales bacterium]
IEAYREVLSRNKVSVTNMYLEYDYEEEVTRLNFVVLFKETTDYIKIFEQLRELHPTRSISLSNQTSI